MNIDELRAQAKAQGGYVSRTTRAPWEGSYGVKMDEVQAEVHAMSRNGFATLRQWARKRGAKELHVYNIDSDVKKISSALAQVSRRQSEEKVLREIADDFDDGRPKYVVLLGWLED